MLYINKIRTLSRSKLFRNQSITLFHFFVNKSDQGIYLKGYIYTFKNRINKIDCMRTLGYQKIEIYNFQDIEYD